MSKFEITQIPRFSAGACEASPSGTCPVGVVHDELSSQITTLSRENAALGEKINGLKEQVAQVVHENVGLKTALDRLEQKIDQLAVSTQPITSGYAHLNTIKKAVFWAIVTAATVVGAVATFLSAVHQIKDYLR